MRLAISTNIEETYIMRFNFMGLLASAGAVCFAAAPSFADNPGRHPAYLHALSDLRDARAHLEHLGSEPIDHAEEHSIDNIDKAIGEIKRAAIDDGKDIHDHMPVDAHLQRTGRFHKALELLEKAKRDASGEEDQNDTRGLQKRVIEHIDRAEHDVHHAIDIIASHS
jgi:hypothetical protein